MTLFRLATRNACRGHWLPAPKRRTGPSTHNNIAKFICLRVVSEALYGLAAHPDRVVIFVPSSQDLIYSDTLGRLPIWFHPHFLQIALLYYCILFNMPSRSFIASFLYATSLVAAASQKCYSLTGTELDNTFAPCNSKAKHSGCCATNQSAGSADICLDNGLCMETKGQYMGTIWQPGCTDSTGKAAECPQLCPGGMSIYF